MKHLRLRALALFLALLAPLVLVGATTTTAHAATQTKLRMFSANVGHQARIPAVRADMRKIKPDVVVLTEAYRACDSIRSIARAQGYNVVQRHCSRGADTAVLVRKNLTIVKHWFLRMKRAWAGPHHGAQPPKSYPVLWVRNAQGQMWVVVGVHFPWVPWVKGTCAFKGGQNLRAWRESWRKVSAFIHRQQTRTVVDGDWNAMRCQLRQRAKDAGARLVPGTKVDHAIVRKVPTSRRHLYQPPNKIDHGWIGFTFVSPAA